MLAEFEQRFADVLGSRLPAPYNGRVLVAPGPSRNNQPRFIISVDSTALLEADFLAHREVTLRGAINARRVVKLSCSVHIRLHTNLGRADQVRALDAVLFQLDASDFRNGTALANGNNPGFLIQKLHIVSSTMPLSPTADDTGLVALRAEGWFWPVNEPEQSGEAIRAALVRAGVLPIQLLPNQPILVAGGNRVDLTLRLSTVGTMRLQEDLPQSLPFGSLALTLRDSGEREGAGLLAGGAAGVDDVRVIPIANGIASFSYTPPAQPAIDYLVVAVEKDNGKQGIELARFELNVREA